MNKWEHIPKDVLKAVVASIPPTGDMYKNLHDRVQTGFFLPERLEHIGLAALCFADLADLIQNSGKALFLAKREWAALEYKEPKPQPNVFAHCTRFCFDYAAVSLVAASNHLASAMWHLHEEIDKPLGKDYMSAKKVRVQWEKRKDKTPLSLGVLIQLLEHPGWKTVHEYRDAWVHRGLPVLEGEIRYRRREIWQEAKEPAPGPRCFMTHTAADGRVAYWVREDHPQYHLPNLMEKGIEALKAFISAIEGFLSTFDMVCAPHGVSFSGDGKGHLDVNRLHRPEE